LSQFINTLPEEDRLERFMRKVGMKKERSAKELTCLKVIIDLKIAFLLASERPRLKVLLKRTLPLAIKLHKDIFNRDLVTGVNEELQKDCWSSFKRKEQQTN